MSGSKREDFGGLLFFFFWPLYIPFILVKGMIGRVMKLFGVYSHFRNLYSRTVGWIKMKLGMWQLFAYRGYSHQFGDVPDWVRNTASKKADHHKSQQTFDLTGRSFYYRVKKSQIARRSAEIEYYRTLKTPLYKRLAWNFMPRRPKTYTEWVAKIGLAGALVYGALFLFFPSVL